MNILGFLRRSLLVAGMVGISLTGHAQKAAPALKDSTGVPSQTSQQVQPVDYKLGVGDSLKISVFQNPELALDTRISDAGVISYPLLGQVKLGGLTVREAEKRLADGLRTGNFVRQPQVSILVMEVKGNQVSVLGQVNKPGRYPLEQGQVHLTDLLAAAGGVAATGAEVVTLVGMRDGQPYRAQVNLADIFAPGQRNQRDLQVYDGDVLWVDRAPSVYIYGEVQRPGAVRLERGMTLMQVLAAGGGLTQRGTQRGLQVHRKGSDGSVQVLRPAMDEILREGDVVYVRESIF